MADLRTTLLFDITLAAAPPPNKALDDKARWITLGCGPSLCAYEGLLHLTLADVNGDHTLFELTYDGHAFGVEKLYETPNDTQDAPCTVNHAGSMYTFYFGR